MLSVQCPVSDRHTELPTAHERRSSSIREVFDAIAFVGVAVRNVVGTHPLTGSVYPAGMSIDRIDHGQRTIRSRVGDRAGDKA